ncbi:MAG TPA: glycosyltransferase family 4 protein [Fimbriimonadaceae bacterium]|nr:glycosyltransferase family 4 protein [Fimbriimonadaceae bacterium]
MKILNHDYAGHAFQIELSRALARRGHEVVHVYNASDTTPKGPLAPRPDDPLSLTITGLTLPETVAKGSLVKRWRQERSYARLAVERLRKVRPEVVISGNTPLDPQSALQKGCREVNARFVYWLQDLTGIATNKILRKKLPVVGAVIGGHYERLEARLLRDSDGIVAISEDFLGLLSGMGVASERIRVIENWAPLEDVTPAEKVNAWSTKQGLAERFAFIYSGAMGMKHNPELLVRLAQAFRDDTSVRVVVISQGIGADWLVEQKAANGLENLVLLPYQPYDELPSTLGSADVLVALLEPSAGTFSVPSKILSYHCAGRPLLVAVPPENLAARTVLSANSGLVVAPTDFEGWVVAARKLREDEPARTQFAANARRYAETKFAIEPITDRFEEALDPTPPSHR